MIEYDKDKLKGYADDLNTLALVKLILWIIAGAVIMGTFIYVGNSLGFLWELAGISLKRGIFRTIVWLFLGSILGAVKGYFSYIRMKLEAQKALCIMEYEKKCSCGE